MGLVISDLFLAIIIIGIVGIIIYRVSIKDDKHDAAAVQVEQEKRKQQTILDAKRYETGVPLICLNCDKRFTGPLTDYGCPSCHTSSLVLTLEEFEKNAKNSVQNNL